MRLVTLLIDTAALLVVALVIYAAMFFLPGVLCADADRQQGVPQRPGEVTEASTMIRVPCPSCQGEGGWHIIRTHWFKPDTDVWTRCEACDGQGKIPVEQLHFLPPQEDPVKHDCGCGPDGVCFCKSGCGCLK